LILINAPSFYIFCVAKESGTPNEPAFFKRRYIVNGFPFLDCNVRIKEIEARIEQSIMSHKRFNNNLRILQKDFIETLEGSIQKLRPHHRD